MSRNESSEQQTLPRCRCSGGAVFVKSPPISEKEKKSMQQKIAAGEQKESSSRRGAVYLAVLPETYLWCRKTGVRGECRKFQASQAAEMPSESPAGGERKQRTQRGRKRGELCKQRKESSSGRDKRPPNEDRTERKVRNGEMQHRRENLIGEPATGK